MQIDQTALIAILAIIVIAMLVLWFLFRARRTAALRISGVNWTGSRQARG